MEASFLRDAMHAAVVRSATDLIGQRRSAHGRDIRSKLKGMPKSTRSHVSGHVSRPLPNCNIRVCRCVLRAARHDTPPSEVTAVMRYNFKALLMRLGDLRAEERENTLPQAEPDAQVRGLLRAQAALVSLLPDGSWLFETARASASSLAARGDSKEVKSDDAAPPPTELFMCWNFNDNCKLPHSVPFIAKYNVSVPLVTWARLRAARLAGAKLRWKRDYYVRKVAHLRRARWRRHR